MANGNAPTADFIGIDIGGTGIEGGIVSDINTLFTERLGRSTAVINDADAAGLAEARCGAGKT